MTIGNPGRPVQLVVDGQRREVTVRTLTDRDLTEITEWLRAEYIKAGRGGLQGMSQADHDRLYLAVVRDAMQVSVTSPEGRRMLGTIEGLARVMWHALRRDWADVTPENVMGYMLNPDNVRTANEYVRALAGDPTRPAGRPAKPSRGTRSTKGSRPASGGRSTRSRT